MKRIKLNIQLFGVTTTLTATQSAIDSTAINNNQSYINLRITETTTGSTWNGEKSAYYQITTVSQNDGTQKGNKVYFSINKTSSKAFDVTLGPFNHNADGSLNNVSISVYTQITSSTHNTKTTSVAMSTIPRASTPSVSPSTATLGSTQVTITATRASSSFINVISAIINSNEYLIIQGAVDSHVWTPPTSLTQYMNSLNATAIIRVKTYNNSVLIGTKDTSLTINTPIRPTYTIACNEGNSEVTLAGITKFVMNKSKINIVTNASSQYTDITEIKHTFTTGQSYYGADTTTQTIENTNAKTFTTLVTDGREGTASGTTTISSSDILYYQRPSIQYFDVQRCNYNGVLNPSGLYMYVEFRANAYDVKTTPTGRIGYKRTIDDNYSYVNLTPMQGEGNEYQLNGYQILSSFSLDYEWNFIFEITDVFETASQTLVMGSGFDLINFAPNGKSMAIGKVSQRTGTTEAFDIAMDTYFDKNIYVYDGNQHDLLIEKNSNEDGTYIKYANGVMICYKTIQGTIDITTAWGSLYTSNNLDLGDFPATFTARPTITYSPQTQSGTQFMVTGNSSGDYGSTTNAGEICLIRPNSRADVAYIIDIIAIGLWK